MYSQSRELAHIGEGVIGQRVDFIFAQISAEAKVRRDQHTLLQHASLKQTCWNNTHKEKHKEIHNV